MQEQVLMLSGTSQTLFSMLWFLDGDSKNVHISVGVRLETVWQNAA